MSVKLPDMTPVSLSTSVVIAVPMLLSLMMLEMCRGGDEIFRAD